MPPHPLRSVRIGQLVGSGLLAGRSARRNEATAFVLPGAERPDAYLAELTGAREDFAAWDGRTVVLEPDGDDAHRLVVVDRYGQVYDVTDARDAAQLPNAVALAEWFRFLTTACPECGVLDDPIGRGWVP